MENLLSCPKCHAEVRAGDYFCANCGGILKPVSPSTSLERQVLLYLGSFFLPPFGIFWGLRYIRQKDKQSRTIGIIAIVLTTVSLLFALKLTIDMIAAVNTVTKQVDQEIHQLDD